MRLSGKVGILSAAAGGEERTYILKAKNGEFCFSVLNDWRIKCVNHGQQNVRKSRLYRQEGIYLRKYDVKSVSFKD